VRDQKHEIRGPAGAEAPRTHHNACLKKLKSDGVHCLPSYWPKARDPVRFFGLHLCHLSATTKVVGRCEPAWRRDTDDTNLGSGDIRSIPWMVNMACPFDMCMITRTPPFSEYKTVPIQPLRRERESCQLSTISIGNEPRATDYGRCFTRPAGAQSKNVAVPASRVGC
jgi:hypothetical protein